MKSIAFEDDSKIVKIDSRVFSRIFQYRQTGALHSEAGGVLIGREIESTGNLIIEEMTEPYGLDKRSRFRFERKDPAHLKCFQALFEQSNETYGYFGEWHTHPEENPQYSCIDLRHWSKIYKDLPERHKVFFLIAGINSVGIWEIDYSVSEKPVKMFEADWNYLKKRESISEE